MAEANQSTNVLGLTAFQTAWQGVSSAFQATRPAISATRCRFLRMGACFAVPATGICT